MNEKELTAKEEAFCVAYVLVGAETFGNGAKSAEEAKYAENSARTQAWRLLRKEHIKKRIRELYDKMLEDNMVTPASVLVNLDHDRKMARKQNQYSVAVRCDELEGKYLALFTDNFADKTIEQPIQLSADEITELKRLAGLASKIKQPESPQEAAENTSGIA